MDAAIMRGGTIRSTMSSLDAMAQPQVSAARADVVVGDAAAADLSEIVGLDAKISGYAREDFWSDLFRRKATSKTLYVLVARSSDKIIGYALGEIRSWPVRDPMCGWLYAIGVEKEHRQQKAATALMTELISRFKKNGVGAIRTMIDIDDHLLMSFLRSFGMTAGPFVELEMKVGQP
jgi:ribosomal protein S18 acetylase RimI-like enzyme